MATIESLVPKAIAELISVAEKRGLTTYKELAAAIGSHPRVMPKVLIAVRTMCIDRGLPPLTTLVVNKATGTPGDACLDPWLPRDTPEPARLAKWRSFLDEVYAFDWAKASLP